MQLPKPRAGFLALLIPVCLFTSCKKDINTVEHATNNVINAEGSSAREAVRAFKASFETWYRFNPLSQPEPIQLNGTNYLGIINVPGGGEGNATHIGKAQTYFNQTAYVLPPDFANIVGTIPAPVSAIPSYPVTGGPLPLIQQGDFQGAAALLASLNVPPSINGNVVSTVIYNRKGDAFFISVQTQRPIVISGTTATTGGTSLIVGGSGKFEGAYGEVEHTIIFDVANPNLANYTLDGWVRY